MLDDESCVNVKIEQNKRIDTSKWKGFSTSDFFNVLKVKNKLSNIDINDGNTPVYSSNSINGGIFGFTKIQPDFIVDKTNPLYVVFGDHTKAINIAEKSFCVMDNVKVLSTKIYNQNILMFIFTTWMKNVPNLGYARHWSEAEKSLIYLPITDDYPDWDYMDSYMNQIIKESEKRINILKKLIN
jgi:hypothetical protein